MAAMTTPDPMTLVYNWRWVRHDEILDLVLLVTEATVNLRLMDNTILKVDELDTEVFKCGQTRHLITEMLLQVVTATHHYWLISNL